MHPVRGGRKFLSGEGGVQQLQTLVQAFVRWSRDLLLLAVPSSNFRMSLRRRLSVPLFEREQQLHEKDIDESLHDHSLQHTANKSIEKKDFTNEVRGTRDINAFLEKSQV